MKVSDRFVFCVFAKQIISHLKSFYTRFWHIKTMIIGKTLEFSKANYNFIYDNTSICPKRNCAYIRSIITHIFQSKIRIFIIKKIHFIEIHTHRIIHSLYRDTFERIIKQNAELSKNPSRAKNETQGVN